MKKIDEKVGMPNSTLIPRDIVGKKSLKFADAGAIIKSEALDKESSLTELCTPLGDTTKKQEKQVKKKKTDPSKKATRKKKQEAYQYKVKDDNLIGLIDKEEIAP